MSRSIDTKKLLSFLAVAETGSFRQAAKRSGVRQSAISRRIQSLEDSLGVSLFERRTTGVRLTHAGSRFAERARAIAQDIEIAEEAARSAGVADNGCLMIGVIASLSRGPLRTVLEGFLTAHGGVEIGFVAADRSELLTLLSHRRIDAVYAPGDPDEEAGDGLVLSRERIWLAAPEDNRLTKKGHLSWADVADAQFVVSARESGPEIHDYILKRVSNLARTVNVRRHRLGREGIMTLVGLGLGVSLVAEHWCGINYPNVRFIRIGDEDEWVPFSLTWRPENDNPALRRFVSLARIEARKAAASLSSASRSPDPSP
ncbi:MULTISPECIES: LysR family transcriptional regulator [unclassified Roseitalea]|uniref:LysR family transcriptional regulator n=1 Tax=unclassified Roseitalea TaxID=2639107 RepID=UPI00273F5EEB|nr:MULTISPECIES: LysR family transcriptional regulator [unclassified Roseitalea]